MCVTSFFNIESYKKRFDIVASELDRSSLFCLGVKLNLSHNDVNEICDLNTKTYHKIYEILTLWQNQAGQQVDLNQLVAILKVMNKNYIAKKNNYQASFIVVIIAHQITSLILIRLNKLRCYCCTSTYSNCSNGTINPKKYDFGNKIMYLYHYVYILYVYCLS